MIRLMMVMIALLFLVGCNTNSNNSSKSEPVYVQPVPPEQPIEKPEPPEDKVPGIGTGSLSYNPTCDSGFATVTYIYRADADIDSNSFVIIHSVDGKNVGSITASAYSNGSIERMEEDIYIQANDTEKQIAHKIDVSFIAEGISRVQSFSFIQPPCEVIDDNATAVITTSII